ncbi:unnamed protein product [Ixodes persulcatus]
MLPSHFYFLFMKTSTRGAGVLASSTVVDVLEPHHILAFVPLF